MRRDVGWERNQPHADSPKALDAKHLVPKKPCAPHAARRLGHISKKLTCTLARGVLPCVLAPNCGDRAEGRSR